MATFYLDLEGGNDANDGTTFANRWKTFSGGATAARIAPGDMIRVMASKDPTSIGSATWTNLSNTVTLAAPVTSIVDPATSAWTASANVTTAANTGTYKNSQSMQATFAAAFTTGKAAYVTRVDESADAGAHRYWRLRFTASANNTDVAVGELEFRASVGGVDATTAGSAIASSEYSASYLKANAFDNNTTTAWNSSGFAAPTYIGWDFGAGVTKNIVEVALRARSDFVGNAPVAWVMEWSDDAVTWTRSWTVSGQTGWATSENRVFGKPAASTLPINLSAHQQVSFWLFTNTAITAGEFSLRLCSDTTGDTTVNTLAIPAIPVVNTRDAEYWLSRCDQHN